MISCASIDRAVHAGLLRFGRDQVGDPGVRLAVARAVGIVVEPLAGLLPEPPGLAQRVGHRRGLAQRLADPPADIQPGQIAHRERSHRKAEAGKGGVHVLRRRAFQQQAFVLARPRRQHPVADEAVADADHHRHLADLPRDLQRGRHEPRAPSPRRERFPAVSSRSPARRSAAPARRAGRDVAAAMALTSRYEVFVARIAPGFATLSSLAKTSCLTAISSNTASMIRSAFARSS